MFSISTFFVTLTLSLAHVTCAETRTHAAISMAGLDSYEYHVFIGSRCSYRTSARFLVDRGRGSGNSRSTGSEQVSIFFYFMSGFTNDAKDANAPVVSGLGTDGCTGHYSFNHTTTRYYVQLSA